MAKPLVQLQTQTFDANNRKNALTFSVGVAAFAAAFVVPVDQLPGMVASGAILLFALALAESEPGHWSQKWRPLLPVLALVAFFVGFGVNAYTDPSPLPKLELALVDSESAPDGAFITHRDSTWYLFNDEIEAIEAYSDRAVASASIDKRPSGSSNDDQTLAGYAWDGLVSVSPFN